MLFENLKTIGMLLMIAGPFIVAFVFWGSAPAPAAPGNTITIHLKMD